jgi:hypothetical protein
VERIQRIETRSDRQVRKRKCSVAVLLEGLWLPAGSVLVLGMVLHVASPDAFGFVDERPLVHLSQHLPLRAESFGDLGVVHFRVFLSDLSSLKS